MKKLKIINHENHSTNPKYNSTVSKPSAEVPASYLQDSPGTTILNFEIFDSILIFYRKFETGNF